MNCDRAKEGIDHYINDKHKLNSSINLHLNTCASCNNYFDESIATMSIIENLKTHKPSLEDPEQLTNDIMAAISLLPETQIKKTNRSKTIQLVTRILAAASVVLFIVYGVEQYIVVDKIIKLEAHSSSISGSNLVSQFIQYGKFYNQEKVFKTIQHALVPGQNKTQRYDFKAMLAVSRFKSSEFSQYDLQKYTQLKNLMQNQSTAHD